MAKDFSKNSNLSFRVVGGAMRRDLVSPGLAWRKRRHRKAMEALTARNLEKARQKRDARRSASINHPLH